jgi:P27 family predicted phage terminase small subunit
MRGRKPVPTHIKAARGTLRADRMNPHEPRVDTRVPSPPEHLSDKAREKFLQLGSLLADHGLVTLLDADALARYAVVWCRWIEAEAEVLKRGPVVKTVGGNIIQNPFLAVANRCLAQLAQAEAEFGLTPTSRVRLRVEPHTDDPIDSIIGFLNHVPVTGHEC